MDFILPLQIILSQLPTFALVLFRIAGLMVSAPILGSVVIPVKVRVLLSAALAYLVFPLVPSVDFVPNNLWVLVFGIGGEMLIGLTMGFILNLTFLGIQIGAELVAQQMGLSFAQIVNPFTQESSNVLSEFYNLLATMIYIAVNGPVVLITSLVATFRTIPLLGALDALTFSTRPEGGAPLLTFAAATLMGAFALGIRIAGPALIAIFLATLSLGFVSRTMPQLNILAAGFPIRIALALVLLVASLGGIGALFVGFLGDAFVELGALFTYYPT